MFGSQFDQEKVYIYDHEELDDDLCLDINKLQTIMEGGSSVDSGGRPSIYESELPSCL